MCLAFYVVIFGLLFLYSDHVIGQFALAVGGGAEAPMVVAVGWEMVVPLWPVLLLAMTAASALSVLITRRCAPCSRDKACSSS